MNSVAGQQAQAVDFLDAWLDSKEQVACLKGYAGTGKTWLMGYWIETVLARKPKGYKIYIIAPTNKALDVLRSKCKNLDVSFMTVDSFLGNKIKKNDDMEIVKSKGKAQDVPDLCVCDEASMVKEEYDKDLQARKMKLLYVGDPAQLPPINEDLSNAFKVPNQFMMTEIKRYDGSIIKVATHLRERIESKGMFLLGDFRQFQDDARSLSFINKSSLYDWACKAVGKGMDARIVAFRNVDVNEHNARMHQLLFPEARLFGVGERVVVNDSFEIPGTGTTNDDGSKMPDEMLYNGQMLTITRCVRVEDIAGVEVHEVDVNLDSNDVQQLEVDGVAVEQLATHYTLRVAASEEHMLQVHKELTNAVWDARRKGDNAEVKRLIDLRKPLNKLAPLRHSYSCTVHKSQGSTYDIAFCDWSSIYQCKDRARMMYVAATRPSKYLVLAS